MIVGIEGYVEKREPTFVHLNLQGLIYEVHTSVHTSQLICSEKIKLFVTEIIKEDSHQLFGFMEMAEKKMFDTLLKINGVGPKVALAVCSTFTATTFAQVIASKDIAMLKRVPGIGPKAASRILVELADVVLETQESENKHYHEASLALESLGFKKESIQKALSQLEGDTAHLVKEGLKRLQRL